jgi:hypothetical protein
LISAFDNIKDKGQGHVVEDDVEMKKTDTEEEDKYVHAL